MENPKMGEFVFLHGLGQNSKCWDKTIGFLKNGNNICVELFSLTEENELTYQNLYNALCNYLEKTEKPVNLCGISLGAMLALNYAIDYPQNVNNLILIAPQYKTPKALIKLQNMIFRLMPEKSFQEMGMKKSDVIRLTSSMLSLDFTDKLKDISCRTTVICGENDKANQKASKAISEKIKGAKFETVKNSGHEVNVDAPKELAEILDNLS